MSFLNVITGKRVKHPNSTPGTPLSPIEETETMMSKKSRRIFVNVEPKDTKGRHIHQSFCSNRVQTSKYTFLTFLPKNLFEQFRSVANFYFTSLVILQLFPPFKNVDPFLTAAPIIIILAVTAAKDAFEDHRRHSADKSVNNAKTYVLRTPSSIPEDQEDMPETKTRKALRILQDFIVKFVLLPLGLIKKSPETVDQASFQPPVLLAADYLHHEKPKRQSTAIRPSTVLAPTNESYWKLKKWKRVKVGDFVLIRSNQSIPADVVIISTSEPDGVCYVETKNLDGETNLKIRRGVGALTHISTPHDCAEIKAFIDVEAPNELMYNFNATIRMNPSDPSAPRLSVAGPRASVERKHSANVIQSPDALIPVTINGVLLRGCVIRNTDWVIGIVVYTGGDTKLMRNAGITPSKRSRIDRQLNPQILLNFMILFSLCFICVVLAAAYQTSYNALAVPFTILSSQDGQAGNTAYVAFVTFFSCMIIFQNIVPIALYISIDVCKTLQSVLINADEEMYDPESDKYALPRTWSLCDDLGQIEYIFSDKTGTLTCNVMEFRKCTINGVMYGNSYVTETQQGASKRNKDTPDTPVTPTSKNKRQSDEETMRNTMKSFFDAKYVSDEPLSFVDTDLHKHLKRGGDQAVAIKQFFALLSVCHTVLAEKYEDDEYAIMYKAQSPDEKALVEAARDNGFAFLRRESNTIFVDILGEEQSFTILHVVEFNSDRKRMSIIIKPPAAMNLPEGDVLLFCKGADSIIYDRLGKHNSPELKALTTTHLEMFANDGLRTLCLCYRIIPKDEYEPWAEKYRNAQSQIKDREKAMDAVAAEIEKDMVLMGATAIEDKLQDGVPESIALLARAGIKIWVLTGDKMETAINIGFACNLLQKNMILIVVKAKSVEETQQQLHEALNKFWDENGNSKEDKALALIIDGDSLTYAFDEHNDKKKVRQATLLELACRCKAVICCRVSPLQKAQVVSLVRKGLGAMCLSIGDGANDVSMIQEADVGIGISGKEGLQAVMASDYAIAQFRFLSRLLLVHGRWAYVRISEMILLYFYKNVVWLFVLFWYQFDSGFTGEIITEFTYGMFFNTIFSLLPNILVGIYDQDVDDYYSIKYPGLYGKGIRQELYNMERFWLYIFDAVYQSVITYYSAILVFGEGSVDSRGYMGDKESTGTAIALYMIITVNIYMGLNNFSWTWLTHFSVYLTIIIFILYVILYASNKDSPTFGQVEVLFKQPQLYFGILLVVITSLIPRIASKAIQSYLYPNDTDIVQEIQKFKLPVVDEEQTSIVDDPDSLFSSANTQDLSQSLKQVKMIREAQSSIPEDSEKGIGVSSVDQIASAQRPVHDKEDSTKRSVSDSDILGGPLSAPVVMGSSHGENVSIIKIPEIKIETSIPSAERKRRSFFSSGEFKSEPSGSKDDDKRGPSSAPLGGGRGRRNSQTVGGAISDMFLQPLSLMSRNVGDFMKNVPRKLRIGSLSAITRGEKSAKSPSLIYMGTQQELPNTGFCFSHEEGMEDVITPHRTHMMNFEDKYAYQLLGERPMDFNGMQSPLPMSAIPIMSPSGFGVDTFGMGLASGVSNLASASGISPRPILNKDPSFDGSARRMSRRTSRVTFNFNGNDTNQGVSSTSGAMNDSSIPLSVIPSIFVANTDENTASSSNPRSPTQNDNNGKDNSITDGNPRVGLGEKESGSSDEPSSSRSRRGSIDPRTGLTLPANVTLGPDGRPLPRRGSFNGTNSISPNLSPSLRNQQRRGSYNPPNNSNSKK